MLLPDHLTSTIQQKHKGFTIVELLIVVVVIAILAAITIVAYNGIQNRAKLAAIQSDVSNAVKQLENIKTTDGSYPATQALSSLKASGGNTLTYTAYNSGNGYCVQYKRDSVSYYATNVVQPKEGLCGPVTNIAVNPSLELNSNLWAARWFGGTGEGTNAVNASGALCGDRGWRKTWTTAGSFQDIGFQYTVSSGVVAGKTYSAAASVRASFPTTNKIWIEWKNSGGTTVGTNAISEAFPSPTVNQTQLLNIMATAPANATSAAIIWGPYPEQNGQPGMGLNIPVGATVDGDCVLFAESNYPLKFADGNSTNWDWSGAIHQSNSFGPAF
jgi:prepilin-type N-terminal cleavage/methylation domain-containing protein